MNVHWLFLLSSAIALFASIMVISNKNAVHALLYLVVSILALALCFYLLGAPFAAALQIIVYAGAIMVLFVFAIMLFNVNKDDVKREQSWLTWQAWIGPVILTITLLVEITYLLQFHTAWKETTMEIVDAKQVGSLLFGPYLLAVEIASFLLLAGLVGGYHLAKKLPSNKEDT